MQSPILAFASSAPPPALTSRALSALRNESSSATVLQSALDGVAAEIVAAEAAVDRLEAERQRLLIDGRGEAALDAIEREITRGNRFVEALAAAQRELPKRIAARREVEGGIDRRAARARELQLQGLAILAEAHGHAAHLARLLNSLWEGVAEIEAVNSEYVRLGLPGRIALPLELLAERVGCSVSELPEVGAWSLPGYWENPVPAERQLGRAKEFASKGQK